MQPSFAADGAARIEEAEDRRLLAGEGALAALSALWAIIFQQQVGPEQTWSGRLAIEGSPSLDAGEDGVRSTKGLEMDPMHTASGSSNVADLLSMIQGAAFGTDQQVPLARLLADRAQANSESVQIASEPAAGIQAGCAGDPILSVHPASRGSSPGTSFPSGPARLLPTDIEAENEAVSFQTRLAGPVDPDNTAGKPVDDSQAYEGVFPGTSMAADPAAFQRGKQTANAKAALRSDELRSRRDERRNSMTAAGGAPGTVADSEIGTADGIVAAVEPSILALRKQIQERPALEVGEVTRLFPASSEAAISVNKAALIKSEEGAGPGLGVVEAEQGKDALKTASASQSGPQPGLLDCEWPPEPQQDKCVMPVNGSNNVPSARELAAATESRPQTQPALRPSAQNQTEQSPSFGSFLPRDSRTISIRIPLTDSSLKPGSPAAHIDLVFHQKNQDLTLQFRSPSSEIQRNLDESMPSLIDRLKAENWAVRPQDSAGPVLPTEPSLDGRRRGDYSQHTATTLDTSRQTAPQAQPESQGFSFDDQTRGHSGSREQKNGRNRKREQVFQSEFEEHQQS